MTLLYRTILLMIFTLGNTVSACEIVDRTNVQLAGNNGVAGSCSNNGEQIVCYDVGEYNGGISCDGPLGTNSGYNLQNLVMAVCGCSPNENESLEQQIDQELGR